MDQAFAVPASGAHWDLRVDHHSTCQITRPPGSWILAPGSLLITDLLITVYFRTPPITFHFSPITSYLSWVPSAGPARFAHRRCE